MYKVNFPTKNAKNLLLNKNNLNQELTATAKIWKNVLEEKCQYEKSCILYFEESIYLFNDLLALF